MTHHFSFTCDNRLAEHVRKALPPTVESQRQVVKLQQHLHGAYLDAEYGLE